MIDPLNIYKHLLPRARAWNITHDSNLRRLFVGLTGIIEDAVSFLGNVWLDLLPQSTRELAKWENQFGLFDTSVLSVQERRDRLEATWKALGGQSPRYIQDTLQAAGFDVYVHEWWVPNVEESQPWIGSEPWDGSEPWAYLPGDVVARNPFDYLRDASTSVVYVWECGTPGAECGEDMDAGETFDAPGYPLVNVIFISTKIYIVECGETGMACGDDRVDCGDFSGYDFSRRAYSMPVDPDTFPFYLYIGGETFPDLADVPSARRLEFERLCLKICPTQLWLGMLINYN